MKTKGIARYGTLAIGSAAILFSAWEIAKSDADQSSDAVGAALFSMGCLFLGSWLTIEIYHLWDEGRGNKEEADPDDV